MKISQYACTLSNNYLAMRKYNYNTSISFSVIASSPTTERSNPDRLTITFEYIHQFTYWRNSIQTLPKEKRDLCRFVPIGGTILANVV